ncbi:hypothetical protein ACWEF9_38460 [Streptomyces sp. NPDC004980]
MDDSTENCSPNKPVTYPMGPHPHPHRHLAHHLAGSRPCRR